MSILRAIKSLRSLSLVFILMSACSNHGVEERTEERDELVLEVQVSEIVGGQNETGWRGVGALTMRVPGYGYVGSFCTGSLITSDWVLTAAHCLVESGDQGVAPSPNNVRFYVGANANPLSSGGEPAGSFYPVDRFVVHPGYDANDLSDDIALMHLSEPAVGVETYDYNEYNLNQYVGYDALYIGFGASDGVSMTGSGVKRSTSLTIGQVVQTQYYSQFNGSGTCFGDSGGPGLLNISGQWRIVGVNSAVSGNVPCQEYYISTRVDTYAPWISNILGAPAPNCQQNSEICLCENGCLSNGSCDNRRCEVLSCDETYECLVNCGEELSCQSLCYAQSTDQAQAELDALLNCFNTRCGSQQGNAFEQCVGQQCSNELAECFPRITGNVSCSELSECVYECPNGNVDCQQTCLERGTQSAQDLFLELNQCYNDSCSSFSTSSDFYNCVEEQCAQLYLSCYPPDGCDITGGSCLNTEACYIGFGGETYCYSSDGVALGSPCEQDESNILSCEDGSVCLDGICTQMCTEDGDCVGSCLSPIFESNTEIGVCVCIDRDEDGVCADLDCDDQNSALRPGIDELCGDERDNDCDGRVDEGCERCIDNDNDGFCFEVNDCDDQDPLRHNQATERCGDSIDNDCDLQIDEGCQGCIDADRDGFCAGSSDCNDSDALISPIAQERCGDGVDNNCDGLIDMNCVTLNQGGPMIVGGDEITVVASREEPSCALKATHPSSRSLWTLILIIGMIFVQRTVRRSLLT